MAIITWTAPGKLGIWMRQTLQSPDLGDWVRYEVAVSWQRCLNEYNLRFAPSFPQPNSGLPFAIHPNPDLLKALRDRPNSNPEALIGGVGLKH